MKNKKRIKVWGKINLFETSAVGIASYPDAHFSQDEFSLLKALTIASMSGKEDKREETEKVTEEETEAKETETAEESTEAEETEETTKEADTSEETEEEEEEEEEAKVELSVKDLTALITKAIKENLKEERGLVEKEESLKKQVEGMSLGELAVTQGLFKPA